MGLCTCLTPQSLDIVTGMYYTPTGDVFYSHKVELYFSRIMTICVLYVLGLCTCMTPQNPHTLSQGCSVQPQRGYFTATRLNYICSRSMTICVLYVMGLCICMTLPKSSNTVTGMYYTARRGVVFYSHKVELYLFPEV